MHKERHVERRETLAYWAARRADTGVPIGRVANITEEGLNLRSARGFRQGERFPLRIMLEQAFAGVGHIDLDVENVWCRKAENPTLFRGGFKILHMPPHARNVVRKMLTQFSYAAPEPQDGT